MRIQKYIYRYGRKACETVMRCLKGDGNGTSSPLCVFACCLFVVALQAARQKLRVDSTRNGRGLLPNVRIRSVHHPLGPSSVLYHCLKSEVERTRTLGSGPGHSLYVERLDGGFVPPRQWGGGGLGSYDYTLSHHGDVSLGFAQSSASLFL